MCALLPAHRRRPPPPPPPPAGIDRRKPRRLARENPEDALAVHSAGWVAPRTAAPSGEFACKRLLWLAGLQVERARGARACACTRKVDLCRPRLCPASAQVICCLHPTTRSPKRRAERRPTTSPPRRPICATMPPRCVRHARLHPRCCPCWWPSTGCRPTLWRGWRRRRAVLRVWKLAGKRVAALQGSGRPGSWPAGRQRWLC